MKVFLLVYTHKHGDDVTVFATAQAAYKAGAEIVAEYFADEVSDDIGRRVIDEALNSGDNQAAVSAFNDNAERESLTVLEKDVIA